MGETIAEQEKAQYEASKPQNETKVEGKELTLDQRAHQRVKDLIYSVIKYTSEGDIALAYHNASMLKDLTMALWGASSGNEDWLEKVIAGEL